MSISTNSDPRGGFTLIEILCVLAILVIISAILLPALSRVQEKGHQSVCQSNLKQLALAFQLYSQDNAGYYPWWFNNSDGGDFSVLPSPNTGFPPSSRPGVPWAKAIQPYIKNTQMLHCPSLQSASSQNPLADGFTDYAYNLNLSGQNDAKFSNSSSLILLEDYASLPGWSYARNSADADGRSGSTIHSGGANYVFVDGHVKWLHSEQVESGSRCGSPTGLSFSFCFR